MAEPTDCPSSKAWWRTPRSALFALAWVLCAAPASASEEGRAALAAPNTHAIMRHALAPGTGDPSGLTLGDCTTQRNLDGRGRAQARRIGEAIRHAGVKIDRVLSSQWCRSSETAELLDLGPVEELPALNSFFDDRSQSGPQTEALRTVLANVPADETLMLVTHQVNIRALTGRGTSSGEVVVFRYGDDGSVDVKARIRTPAP